MLRRFSRVDTSSMHRKACRRMTRRRTLAATLLAIVPTITTVRPASADPIFWAARLAAQDAPRGGGAVPAPAPAPGAAPTKQDVSDPAPESASLADVTGEPTKIDLPALLQATVRHSPALATARVEIEVAEAAVQEARGVDDWVIDAQGTASYTRGEGQTTFRENAITSYDAINVLTLGANGSITRLLPTGGTVSLHAGTTYTRSELDNLNVNTVDLGDPTTTEHADELRLQASQPLLRGRGSAIARAQIAIARIQRDAAALDQRRIAIQEVSNVVQGYWDLVFALRDLEIRRSSLDLARERLRLTQAGINGGKVAPSEALAVEQVIATREEEILAAEITVLDQSITLRRTAGLAIAPGQLALTTETELAVPKQGWDLAKLSADAQRTSPELAVLATQEKGATIQVEVAENGLLPTLDLGLALTSGVTRDNPSDAAIDTLAGDNLTGLATLTYQQFIGNSAAKGQTRRARAERLRIKVTAVDVQFQINEAIAKAVAIVRSAEQRVELGARAVKLAEQNIAVEQSRFNLGKSTNFDVLLRQDELKQAQLRQARALVDWHKAKTVIQALTGELLEGYGVSLEAE
jgi:outer membrane protein